MREWLILCEDKRLERLKKLGIRLDKLEKLIPWETFRPEFRASSERRTRKFVTAGPWRSNGSWNTWCLRSKLVQKQERVLYIIATPFENARRSEMDPQNFVNEKLVNRSLGIDIAKDVCYACSLPDGKMLTYHNTPGRV